MQPPSILHLSFNQDAGCFAVGTTHGFIVFSTDPFGESLRRNFSGGGGVGVVQMLFRCNILALVGAVESSRNKVVIWDDHLNHCIGELLFRTEVKAVRLRPDRIGVVMLQKIYVYNFSDWKLILQIETLENQQGLCEISQTGSMVLVCLGLQMAQTGSMVLVCLGLQRGFVYATKKCKHVMAHSSSVAFVALMNDGRLMATASSKGTLVRVFSTTDGSLLQEVRRGSERAVICSLCFSWNAQWLAVSSDKGTAHVFSLKADSRSLRTSVSQTAETNNLAPLPVSRLPSLKVFCPSISARNGPWLNFTYRKGCGTLLGSGSRRTQLPLLGVMGGFTNASLILS